MDQIQIDRIDFNAYLKGYIDFHLRYVNIRHIRKGRKLLQSSMFYRGIGDVVLPLLVAP